LLRDLGLQLGDRSILQRILRLQLGNHVSLLNYCDALLQSFNLQHIHLQLQLVVLSLQDLNLLAHWHLRLRARQLVRHLVLQRLAGEDCEDCCSDLGVFVLRWWRGRQSPGTAARTVAVELRKFEAGQLVFEGSTGASGAGVGTGKRRLDRRKGRLPRCWGGWRPGWRLDRGGGRRWLWYRGGWRQRW